MSASWLSIQSLLDEMGLSSYRVLVSIKNMNPFREYHDQAPYLQKEKEKRNTQDILQHTCALTHIQITDWFKRGDTFNPRKTSSFLVHSRSLKLYPLRIKFTYRYCFVLFSGPTRCINLLKEMRVVDLSEYGFEAARTPPLGHLSGPQAKMVLYSAQLARVGFLNLSFTTVNTNKIITFVSSATCPGHISIQTENKI
ncbi:hypothetical protein WN51_09289 [Melipona quadrifasciata]|uniref:Uncharacterized protein n=1 Tax=Melipona quadrifasciata TaxID=166423 RepID=A0A0N0U6D7_9HYME|nr:hypothetical protein WN51_09289 [Melipona quadrifasciata]